jgi:hypothetical protein
MPSIGEALSIAASFAASAGEEKSRELILALLEHTPAPFSRHQFQPATSPARRWCFIPTLDAFC